MDPLLMLGAAAASITAIVGVLALGASLFARGVKVVVRDELGDMREHLRAHEQKVDVWLTELERRVDALTAEFRPNGGSSIRDQLDRLERMLSESRG